MLEQLTSSQRTLADYMAQLSELAFSAGWLEGLEHSLWRAVVEGPFRYGHLDLTHEHVAKLWQLSNECEGWIVFDGVNEETFVPLRQWQMDGYRRPQE